MKKSYAFTASETELLYYTIGEHLEETVTKYPETEALVATWRNERYTYREFYDICRRAAKGFMKLGVAKGDRVAIWATNYPEWVITQFATAIIGAILVTVNPAYRSHELDYCIRDSQSQTLLLIRSYKTSDYLSMFYQACPETKNAKAGAIESKRFPYLKNVIFLGKEAHEGMYNWEDLLEMGGYITDEDLKEREESLDPDDVINIQYTSGTTGLPKGASLTHRGILNNGFCVAEYMKFTSLDKLCIPVPFYHCFGMVLSNLACVTHGATMVLPSEYFEPLAVLETVERERCTALHGVPTMFIAELEHPEFSRFNLTSLRTGIMAGSPCPMQVMKRVVDQMHAHAITICYGLTECSPVTNQTATDDSLELRCGTVGRPLPHVEVKIVDPETGKTVPKGQSGELCARGYLVMRGYYNNPEETAGIIDEASWLHTGDLAEMDENGYCKIVGRIKDMIIRGGENVYPREIEEFLYTNPKIKDVQVIGVPDSKFGEQIAAWIQLKEGQSATPEEIENFCKGRIAHYKVPKYIKFVDDFPTTVTGKIQKYKMREITIKELALEQ